MDRDSYNQGFNAGLRKAIALHRVIEPRGSLHAYEQLEQELKDRLIPETDAMRARARVVKALKSVSR